MICVDASVAAKWVLREDDTEAALRLYSAHVLDGLISPPFLRIEVTNAIWRRVPRGELDLGQGRDALRAFLRFRVTANAPDDLYDRAMQLASEFERPAVYDMHYVALAQIAGCDLWTADRRLVNTVRRRLPFVRDLADFEP